LNTTALTALIKRDLRLFLTDRRAVLMVFAAPIFIASFFGYIFGGGRGNGDDRARVAVLIVDQDQSRLSNEIIAGLTAEKSLEVKTSDLDQARAAVRKGSATVAIAIPAGFGAGIAGGFFNASQKPAITVLYDPSHSIELNMVEATLTGHVMQAVGDRVFGWITRQSPLAGPLAKPAGDPSSPSTQGSGDSGAVRSDDSNQSAPRLTIPYSTNEEAVTSGMGVEYNGYAHSFAGMGIQFILFMGIEVGIGVLLQRQRGLWKRLRAAPISRSTLLGSRTISAAINSLIVLVVLFSFARLVFGVRIQGSLLGFIGICVAFSLMTGAFGLLIAALGKTPEAARGLAIFVTLLLVMLGGAWVPTFIFPQWLQKLTIVIPTRWAVDGLDAMTWRGLGLSSAIGPIAVLLLFSVIFGALAVSRFRWEAEG
jgi:ABC-2 type transport system permease protein